MEYAKNQTNFPRTTRDRGLYRFGNYFKTTALLAGVTALGLLLGQRLGGPSGLAVAGVFVLLMNFISYWFSDRIALAIHGARPLERSEAPWLYELVESLSRGAGMPVPRLYLIPTATPNA